MTCANILVGLGKDREGMETGDAGREGGDAAICVAPRRERRKAYLRTYCCILNFNPRSPRRERHREHQETRSAHQISIHAPAKGATRPMPQRTAARLFQSTLPRRERPNFRSLMPLRAYFNPRSREGSDDAVPLVILEIVVISIHAPAKGATAGHRQTFREHHQFQSTLPRRERPSSARSTRLKFAFQSMLPRRERPRGALSVTLLHPFQSTLP